MSNISIIKFARLITGSESVGSALSGLWQKLEAVVAEWALSPWDAYEFDHIRFNMVAYNEQRAEDGYFGTVFNGGAPVYVYYKAIKRLLKSFPYAFTEVINQS